MIDDFELEDLELELGVEEEASLIPDDFFPEEPGTAVEEEETVPGAEPDGQISQETEPAAVEVISVDELLERLAGTAAGELSKEETEEPLEESVEPEEPVPPVMEVTGTDGGPLLVQGTDDMADSLLALRETLIHPALTTPFSEYTVTEALLLLLFLAFFLSACFKLLRGAFLWLRS